MRTRVIDVERFAGSAEASGGGGRKRSPPWLSFAVRALRAGKIVAFPTETVYGVGTIATDARAVDRLRELKSRPKLPFTVHLPSPEDAGRYVAKAPVRARTLMKNAWPGPLTLLLRTGGRFADPGLGGKPVYRRICPEHVVGLRCPDEPVAQALLERTAKPVLATSANLRGRPAPGSGEEVLAQLDGRIDLLLDGGATRHRKGSTIVAFDGEEYTVVRAGVYDARKIARMTRRTILFICTGNTCRSPMAAGLATRLLAERLDCDPGQLPRLGQEVLSAGVFAAGGARASAHAVEAAAGMGADIEKHRSRRMTNELINAADLIFCMTRQHVEDVIAAVPDAAGKTLVLDAAGNIADPIGGDARTYERTAGRIEKSLRRRMKENLL
jgi:tRNA threonylcarbamoyl adenosine modification protein (Sua5/YciO/YrdC/YwlC family)